MDAAPSEPQIDPIPSPVPLALKTIEEQFPFIAQPTASCFLWLGGPVADLGETRLAIAAWPFFWQLLGNHCQQSGFSGRILRQEYIAGGSSALPNLPCSQFLIYS